MIALFKALDVLPGWLWALLCAGAISSAAVTGYQLRTERQAHQSTKATYAAQVAAAERAAREQSEKNRATEQELRNAQDTHAKEVAALHLDLDGARADARTASVGLQNAARAAATRARAQCANTTTSELRPSTDDPIGMFAYVLGLVDERAERLADIAEQRGIAGRACEHAYDTAREALKD